MLATAVWHERYVGRPSPSVEALAADRVPDLYLLTGDEIPFVQDGLRDGEHLRHAMQDRFREVLAAQDAPWVEVRGTPAERLAQALALVEPLLDRPAVARRADGAAPRGGPRPGRSPVSARLGRVTTHPDETFAQVSAAPTRAGTGAAARPPGARRRPALRRSRRVDRDRRAGRSTRSCARPTSGWSTTAIISPHYDVEFHDPDRPRTRFRLGDSKAEVDLPTDQSYSSFVLLPLLTFAVRGRCLLVGGPGRGKTASAVLMGVLAGYPVREVRRAMQHGHPQLTVAGHVRHAAAQRPGRREEPRGHRRRVAVLAGACA